MLMCQCLPIQVTALMSQATHQFINQSIQGIYITAGILSVSVKVSMDRQVMAMIPYIFLFLILYLSLVPFHCKINNFLPNRT